MTSIYAVLGATASSPSRGGGERAAPNLVSVPDEAEARGAAVSYMESLVGTPYVWGGKDPKVGLDCSGAVTVAYERAGLAMPGARYRYGSADLHKVLEPTADPRPGDLAFYGEGGRVSHVMMVVGDGQVAGATGGGPKTRTPDDARAIGAYVKKRPADYRKNKRGESTLISYGRAPRLPLGGKSGTRLETAEAREERAALAGKGVLAVLVGGLLWGVVWWWRTR